MSTKNYRPMRGTEARLRLNELGYDVPASDEKDLAIIGLIVALAEEIESLRVDTLGGTSSTVFHAIRESAEKEREACALLVETLPLTINEHKYESLENRTLISIVEAGCRAAFAEAIRARGAPECEHKNAGPAYSGTTGDDLEYDFCNDCSSFVRKKG